MSSTADWVRLSDRRFQLVQFFQTEPPLSKLPSFSPCLTAVAPYTGEIAIARNTKKLVDRSINLNGLLVVSQAGNRLYELRVGSSYYSNGSELPNFSQITAQGILLMHWIDEKLFVLGIDMKLYIVVSGRVEMKYSLEFDFEDDVEFICGCGFLKGIAILVKTNSTLKVCLVSGLNEGETRCVCTWLADMSHFFSADDINSIKQHQSEIAMTVVVDGGINPHMDLTRFDVLIGFPEEISCGDSLIRVNTAISERKLIGEGPFFKLQPSPNHKFVSAITFSSDRNEFSLKILLANTLVEQNFNVRREGVPPDQIVWIGNVAIAVYWSSETLQRERTSLLLVYDTNSNYTKFQFYGSVLLSQEIDGVRVIETGKTSFLQEVPKPLQDIFGIGAISSAEEVYSSYQNYQSGGMIQLKNIRDLPDLREAVDTCLKAAACEFNQQTQRELLKAANFGKSFQQCQKFNHDRFVETCKNLRVLNAVRSPKYGIPLTFQQFIELKPKGLIKRLIARQQHYFAMKICEYLSLDDEKTNILLNWAQAKVLQEDISEEEILQSIKTKLSDYKGVVSFAAIAAVAFRNSKESLAIDLLKLEPMSGEQVPLLLKMKKYETALERAIDSGETDLVYLVLLEMKQSQDKSGLARIMENSHFSVARNLLISFLKEQNIDFLKTMFEVLQDYREEGNLHAFQSFQTHDSHEKSKLLFQSIDFLGRDKNSADDKLIVENQRKLLRIQRELDDIVGKEIFTDLSLSDTIYQLIRFSDQYAQLRQSTESLKKEFKMNDSNFAWIKVRALSKSQRWGELYDFASKKSPIGYRPFAEACLENGNESEALKYIALVSDISDKIELYCHPSIANYEAAIQIAHAKKDPELLRSILLKSPEEYRPDLQRKIESLS